MLLLKEFRAPLGDCVVEPAGDGAISVLTNREAADADRRADAVWAYRIERPGVLSHGPLRYAFRQDLVYNVPYSRFAFVWSERSERPREVAAEAVRRDVSRLLFEHLKQIKRTQMRLVETHIERRRRKGNLQKEIRGVTPEAMAYLVAYRWPGNVRERESVIQRMMVVGQGDVLERSDLPPEIQRGDAPPADRPKDLKEIARESAEIVERQAIVEALANTGGNVTKAARALGISRATLQNRMKAFGLRGPRG